MNQKVVVVFLEFKCVKEIIWSCWSSLIYTLNTFFNFWNNSKINAKTRPITLKVDWQLWQCSFIWKGLICKTSNLIKLSFKPRTPLKDQLTIKVILNNLWYLTVWTYWQFLNMCVIFFKIITKTCNAEKKNIAIYYFRSKNS